jgi:CHAD domain-containing protein
VRDLDVALQLLDDLERRAPAAAPAAAFCRRELVRQRTAARRRLVRKLDDLSLRRLPELFNGRLPRVDRALSDQACHRAAAVAQAVDHASGVYFPKRAHAARIEIKKLRYLVEFQDPSDRESLKVLRKGQEILGDIQDRQVVQGMVQDLLDGSSAPDVDLAPLVAMLEAECVVLYDRFIERRGDVLDVCERIASRRAAPRSALVTGALLTAGAVVAGSIVPLRRRST